MNWTLRQLKVFEAVARHLNFTRASEELHLTQPAVSMQIKQLEEAVGLPLFEQLGKKIYLTEAGRELHHYCRAVSRQLDEAETVLAEMKGLKRGRLKIAVVTSANSFASQILASFCRQYGSVSTSLRVNNRETVLDLLMHNEVDLAIMGPPPQSLDLAWQAFMENPLVLVAASAHPLVRQSQIPLTRLQKETFLVREEGSGTRIAMEQFFARQGIKLNSEVEMSSNEAIKEGIQAGLGLGVVSMHTILLELETRRLAVLDVEQFPIRQRWCIVHHQDKRLTAIVQAFKEFIISEAPRFVFQPQMTSQTH